MEVDQGSVIRICRLLAESMTGRKPPNRRGPVYPVDDLTKPGPDELVVVDDSYSTLFFW
jgi:hypothetical protein